MSRTAPKIDNRFETNGYEMTEGEAKAAVEDHLYIFKSGISPGAACTFASASWARRTSIENPLNAAAAAAEILKHPHCQHETLS